MVFPSTCPRVRKPQEILRPQSRQGRYFTGNREGSVGEHEPWEGTNALHTATP